MDQLNNKEIFERLMRFLTIQYSNRQEVYNSFMNNLTLLEDINYCDEKGKNIVYHVLTHDLLTNTYKLDVLKYAVDKKNFDVNSRDSDGLNVLSYFLDHLLYEKQSNENYEIDPDVYLIISFFIDNRVNFYQGYGSWDAPIQIARELGDDMILELMGDNEDDE